MPRQAQAEENEEIDVYEIVFGHIEDAYEWHITDIGDASIRIPLPVIVKSSSGWHVFSSARLRNQARYEGLYIAPDGEYKNKIVEKNATGEEIRPFDISITKNVLALFINSIILVAIMLGCARWYKRHEVSEGAPKGGVGMIDFGAFRAEDGTPIYLQIIKYLKQGVVSGAVADGDELPSRRVLSALLGLNPNTVQKACRMLEEEGLLVSHAGAKSCVRVTPELRERVRAELIRSDAVAAASAFRRMGVPLEEAIELVKRAYEEALKRCRTKEEVQRLKLAHLGASLSVVNAVKNDPHITKAKKLEILMLENGKMANLEKATQKFMESSAYKKLPGEREPGPDQIPVMEAAVEHLPKPDLEGAAQLDIGKSEERVPYPAPNGSWTEPEETEAPERRTFWPARSRRRFEAKV